MFYSFETDLTIYRQKWDVSRLCIVKNNQCFLILFINFLIEKKNLIGRTLARYIKDRMTLKELYSLPWLNKNNQEKQ